MFNLNNKWVIILILVVLALGLIFVWHKNIWEISTKDNLIDSDNQIQGEISPLSGLTCQNYQRRPLAIVFANDPVARPLHGLSQADLVIEMPVITNSITRIIAFYICNFPEEIGSMRSARHDFIPLAMGFDAILAHWGGSHFALEKLNAGIMDNIDALKNPANAFYRKNTKSAPHNGFTSIENLIKAAKKLNYRLENRFEGYLYAKEKNTQNEEDKILRIEYSYPYNVSYEYDSETNSYLRWRTNTKEIDANNNQQVRAKNIVIMKVLSEQIEGPYYNNLNLEGEGQCQIYQNGEIIPCIWQKSENNPASKLKFLDNHGEEILFVPGQIWIEIVEPDQKVVWE